MASGRAVFVLPETLWTEPDRLLFTAAMLLIFLLTLISLAGLTAARREMLCKPNTCYILHMEPGSFHQAQNACKHDGGYLMTLRDRSEEKDLLSLLSLVRKQTQNWVVKLWIGLKRKRTDCVRRDMALRGFKWVSGEEDSQYSNWEQEPVDTCTQKRCVAVDYSFSDPDELKWTPGNCGDKAAYACKFYFSGMCQPLVLLGSGKIVYESIFSEIPLNSELDLLPFGTAATVFCGGHKPTSSLCNHRDDTYLWTDPGPFCGPETQNCGRNNGGCEHECRQEGGAVRCFCRDGFSLDEDGFSCRMMDECRPDSCQHQCVMGQGGFSCTCPSGFRLSKNQRNCSDVDECIEAVCHQGCINTRGSFICFCHRGFHASTDGRSCVDVNECVSDPCPHHLVCVNTIGSFICRRLETQENITTSSPQDDMISESSSAIPEPSSLSRTTVELQHPSPHTDAPLLELLNATNQLTEHALASARSKVMICVLGSVVPLLALIALTLFIAIFRCSRSKAEVKKKSTADGYCWVSSGLDPRLEKLYESILTDDL